MHWKILGLLTGIEVDLVGVLFTALHSYNEKMIHDRQLNIWGGKYMYSYGELRTKYETFIYEGYDIEENQEQVKLTYHFSVEGLSDFAPTWIFPKTSSRSFADDERFKEMVFSLGMVELVSYWKIACPKNVRILSKTLSKEQIAWWKSLYFNGLGEFYYTNGIEENEKDFMTIIPENGVGNYELPFKKNDVKSMNDGAKCLVPIGGGKDSVVSLDVLSKYGDRVYAYIINPRGATSNTVSVAKIPEDRVIVAKRTLDKNMLELNKQGFLNGHTPFSAIVAFSSTIAAYMNEITYITLSNESSANESTVLGSSVNHQYSKSFQFEKDFHEYEKEYIGSGTYYFSLLRPLSEFQIAADFATCTDFHPIFRSCNVGSKEDKWCGHCPKCLFVWMILSPFLSQERLTEIFGNNIALDMTMKDCFDKLIGVASEKPFECVGSVSEVNAAVTFTIRNMEKEGRKLPKLFEYYKETGLYEDNLSKCEDYFHYYDENNLIPEEFEVTLNEKLREKLGKRAPRQ